MSQAVAAPNTGDPILASGKSANLAVSSRRAVLASMMLTPAALAIPAGAALHADAATLAAWDRYRYALLAYDAADDAGEEEDATYREWQSAEAALWACRPVTPQGVAKQLRAALAPAAGLSDWAYALAFDRAGPEDWAALADAEDHVRALWHSVQALEATA